VGYPAAAVLEATTTGDVRLLGIDAERTAALRKEFPYYTPGEIPAGAYPGVSKAIPTVAMMNWVVADQTLDDEVVTGLLNILDRDRVSLEQVHEMAEQIDLDRLSDAPIPLHPATERWRAERER
jgi:TRAP transporter TAXI family solute receptor